jgi:prevent-host-death family protein
MTVNVHEAKTNLSALLKRVEEGEEIIIARAGKPVAQLVPAKPNGPFPLGFERGRIKMSDDFDDPLPPELLALFTGEPKKRKVRR